MEPEKKLWTAETEIYRFVMSNGEFEDWNWVNSKLGFRFLDSNFVRKFLRGEFLMFWLGFGLLKYDFGLQKLILVPILIKMTPIEFCIFDIFIKSFFEILLKFWFSQIPFQKWDLFLIILIIFIVFVVFFIFLFIFVVFELRQLI